ncbi:hypothetical protein [Pseudomonas sp.]|uniref:hypothetical protein n=1 Tax=Pseudomonas sp. TaxID=306 RepID=UPI003D122D2D
MLKGFFRQSVFSILIATMLLVGCGSPQPAHGATGALKVSAIEAGNIIHRVGTLAELKALKGGVGRQSVYVEGRLSRGDGYQGVFLWQAGDYSADPSVVADSLEGGHVKPTTPGDGSAGVWKRFYSGNVFAEWFGAKPNDAVDDTAAFVAAYALSPFVSFGEGIFDITTFGKEIAGGGSLAFRGAGSDRSFIQLNGGASDVYSYTLGTTTLQSAIFFSTGGTDNVCDIGGFTVLGNTNVDNGLAVANMFRGSVISDISFREFRKSGAVPLTLYRNVELIVENVRANFCDRFIRLVGMNDGVRLKKAVAYNFSNLLPAVFVEVGWNSEIDTLRFPVQLVFDEVYFHGGDTEPYASMAVGTRVAIELTNSRDTTIHNCWFERVGYALQMKYAAIGSPYDDNNYLHLTGSIRGGTDIPAITLEKCSQSKIEWDWPITLDSASKYNRIIHNQIISTVTDNTTYKENDIFAYDRIRLNGYGRPIEFSKMTVESGDVSPSGTRTGPTLYVRTNGTGQVYAYNITDNEWIGLNLAPTTARKGPVFQAAAVADAGGWADATAQAKFNALLAALRVAKILSP